MALKFNGTNIESIKFNGTALDKLIYNGVTVWENWKTVIGANFLPISSGGSSFTITHTSASSGFNFKNPTFHCSGRLDNGDDFPIEGKVIIEAYNVSSGWVTLYTHQTGDIAAGSDRYFDFTYSETSGAFYRQWRITKVNASNTALINGSITSYTYKP